MLSLIVLIGLEIALSFAWQLVLLAFVFTLSIEYGTKLLVIFILQSIVTYLVGRKSNRLNKTGAKK